MTDRFTCPCCGNEFRLTAEKITPPEPEQQEIKLYCVKGYSGCFTKGKVYDFKPTIIMDSGYVDDNHENFADFNRVHPQFRGGLIPLVQRPAAVGEWVYISKKMYDINNTYSIGDVCQVLETYECGVFIKTPTGKTHPCNIGNGTAYIDRSEYLVLDGYKGEST